MPIPFLNSIRSFLAPPIREDANPRQLLKQKQQELRAAEKKLAESMYAYGEFIDPFERYRDGDDFYGPGNALAGNLNARATGGDWILLRNPQDLRNIRADTRILVETNSYAAGFLGQLVNFIIGDGMEVDFALKGPQPGAVAGGGVVDQDGDGVQDTAPAVKKAEWIKKQFCDKNDWGCGVEDRELESCERSQRDAEVFLRFFADEDGIPRVRFTEPEQIEPPPGDPDPMGTVQYDASYTWSWGIECDPDDAETRLRYYVRPLNQTAAKFIGKAIDADEFVYAKLGTDRTVKRGISPFAVVASAFRQAEKINNAMSEVTHIQASIAYIREHAATTLPGQIADLTAQASSYQTRRPTRGGDKLVNNEIMEPGTRLDVSAGLKFLAGPASTAAPAYISVLQSRLRQICARFGMPEFFTGDGSNANYASTLVTGGPFERAITRAQKQQAGFTRAVFQKVLRMATDAGLLTEEEYESLEVVVTPDPASIANKLEEAQIRQIENQAGVLSVQTWQQETGRDTAQEAANIEAYKQLNPDAGGAGMGADFGGLFDAGQESFREVGPPPFEGAVFDKTKHRWVKPSQKKPSAKKPEPKTNTPVADKIVSKGPAGGYIEQAQAVVKGKIKDTKDRAWNGKQEGEPLDIHLAGAIGEEIIIAHLKQIGYADADYTSSFIGSNNNNIPFDLIHDHQLVEAKTGQVGKPSGVWALKYDGRFNKDQEAAFVKMSPEQVKLEKKKINADKVRRIHERKQQFADGLAKDLKYKITPGMITVIVNPATKTADLYQFDGLHDSIGWNSDKAKAGYLKSVKYG